MRSFPLFQIKYTPRSRCKVHHLTQAKILVQEQAVRAEEQRLADNDTEGEPSSCYRGLELNDTEGIINDDEEEDEDEDMDVDVDDDEEEIENEDEEES